MRDPQFLQRADVFEHVPVSILSVIEAFHCAWGLRRP
jgi:hypothetical protein